MLLRIFFIFTAVVPSLYGFAADQNIRLVFAKEPSLMAYAGALTGVSCIAAANAYLFYKLGEPMGWAAETLAAKIVKPQAPNAGNKKRFIANALFFALEALVLPFSICLSVCTAGVLPAGFIINNTTYSVALAENALATGASFGICGAIGSSLLRISDFIGGKPALHKKKKPFFEKESHETTT